MTHEEDTNKQRVIIDLEDETETLKEELRTTTSSSTIKKHVEYLVKKQDDQITRCYMRLSKKSTGLDQHGH